MSFRLFIYYCALCGGWTAFLGWLAGVYLAPKDPLGNVGIRAMWLGIMVALGLGLVDSFWNLAASQFFRIAMRTTTGVMVGCFAGLLGGVAGQKMYGYTGWELFYVLGWALTGALIGISVGVYELVAGFVLQKDMSGALKKLAKALVGGTVGGLLGGLLSMGLKFLFGLIYQRRDVDNLSGPTAWGFVALGMCIGLLIGLAQVILKEAWIRVEKGRRAGRELILGHERTTIGRAEVCDIGLFGDNQIERLHASIVLADGRYYVEDERTPVGTYVNEQRVAGRVPLKSGDLIRVGGSVLCFRERAKR